jgi:AcrR family transcriptional regulator
LKFSARKLFVERGYHATRPQDIAREAGLGHGTFYLHYRDKRACFHAFI